MKTTILRFTAPLFFALAFVFGASGQSQPNRIAQWIQTVQSSQTAQPVHMFDKAENQTRSLPVANAAILDLDHDLVSSMLVDKPAFIELKIPTANDQHVKLTLARVEVMAPDFKVGTKGSNAQSEVPYTDGIHYRGIVEGDNNSVAAISIYNNNVIGFYSNAEGNFTIGKLDDGSEQYAVFNSAQLSRSSLSPDCFADAANVPDGVRVITHDESRGVGCKTVNVYFECDNAFYVSKGSSTTNVVNYVTAFFNQCATLYANENIAIQISQVYVWTTIDPYSTYTTTSDVLNHFQSTVGTNFNGNLAHFLTTRNLGGGIAYVDVLCTKSYAFGVSMIYGTYSNVPTYSWTVECVTHELGHNLGSPHTQSCTWPGGPIDNCYAVEGTCSPGPAPVNGGTIMSYCHLTSYGINFNNGFGPLPGNLIRDRVTNATCITASGSVPSGLTSSNITSSSAVLTWVAVAGATQYTLEYKPSTSSTWTTLSPSAALTATVTGLAAGTTYNWNVKTDCSAYATAVNFITLTNTTACSAPISLSASNISSSGATLTWGAVSGATSYTVQYKSSAATLWTTFGTFTSTTASVSGLTASTTYNWQVMASCSGYSTTSSFTTTAAASTTCGTATSLSTTNISGASAKFNWAVVPGATSYKVMYRATANLNWVTVSNIATNYYIATGLSLSSQYRWKVVANCATSYSPTVYFNTPSALVAGNDNTNDITLHPNPAQNELHISLNELNTNETVKANVYNVAGALVFSMQLQSFDNVVDVSKLSQGMYFVHVLREGSEPQVLRFIKN